MKRFILSSLLIAGIALSLTPHIVWSEEVFDFGGQVRVLSGWEGPGDGVLLEGEPSLWIRGILSPTVSFELAARLLSTVDTPRLLDLERGVIHIQIPRYPELDSSFTFQGGRLKVTDFSTYVFDHRLDGALFQWKFPFTRIELSGGYTGWQPREVSQIYLSRSDAMDADDSTITYGPPRTIQIATFTFPRILLSQDLILSFVAQQDLRSQEAGRPPVKRDRVFTNYLGLGSEGKLRENIHLSLFGYLSLGFVGVSSRLFSGIYGTSVVWKGKDKYRSEIEGVFVSASGDDRLSSLYDSAALRESNLFLPVSKKDTGVAFSPLLANITFLQLRGGLFPLPKVWAEAQAFLFFRTTGGPISESGVDPLDRSDLFLGPEWDLKLEWQVYSDLKIRSNFGFFLPATGSVGAFSRRDPWVKGTIEVLFSF